MSEEKNNEKFNKITLESKTDSNNNSRTNLDKFFNLKDTVNAKSKKKENIKRAVEVCLLDDDKSNLNIQKSIQIKYKEVTINKKKH